MKSRSFNSMFPVSISHSGDSRNVNTQTGISVVKTPWYDYVVVDHNNPFFEGEVDYWTETTEIKGGKHYFSLKNSDVSIFEEFPKWLKYHEDLKIRSDSISGTFKICEGTVKDLFSHDYLTKRGEEIRAVHKKLENDPKIHIKVETMDYYREQVKNFLHGIIFQQLIVDSSPVQLKFEHSKPPRDLFVEKRGLMLTDADVCNYSFRAGNAFLYGISDINEDLRNGEGIFPYYTMSLDEPIEAVAKYLSPGECVYGDLGKLKEEERIFYVDGNLMIIQPKDCIVSPYNAIRD